MLSFYRLVSSKYALYSAALFLLASILLTPLLLQGGASAEVDIQGWLCAGVNFDVSEGTCLVDPSEGTEAATLMINKVIALISLGIGVISVVMIMIGGVKYITSGGDSGNVTGAKNTILYAVIGLVIVALAQVIVRFVLSSISEI